MPIGKLQVHNGRITVDELKSLSREFDLESIHSINLSGKGLNDLSDLEYCTGLERLDLHNNKLCRVQWIQDLTQLVYLDLSQNDLSNLEPLRNLENLKFLNVSGNAISAFDAILCLKHLPELANLHFKDGTELTNPICLKSGYPDYIVEMLPQVQFLDGEKVRGDGAKFFYSINNILQEEHSEQKTGPKTSKIEVPLIGQGSNGSQVSEHLAEITARTEADDAVEEALVKFSRLVAQCNELCEAAQDEVEWATRKIKTN